MNSPPFGESHCPVKYELSSDARKTAVAATSSGRPKRDRGICEASAIFIIGEKSCVMGVSIQPGQIALTRMLREETSNASERVRERIPPLAAPYRGAMG